VVYLADQAHVPYGDRAPEELVRLLAANVAYLEGAGVEGIVMGCNTSCAIAASFGYPPARVPILDLIEAAAGAVSASGASRVGVLATSTTVRSGAYGAAIRRRAPALAVEERAAPALVPLVEAGTLHGPQARAAVSAACGAFGAPFDALVYACSHYPLLDAEFAAVLGPRVVRLDPAEAQAVRAAAFARASGALGRGRTRYVTTGPLEPFAAALAALGQLQSDDDVVALRAAKSI